MRSVNSDCFVVQFSDCRNWKDNVGKGRIESCNLFSLSLDILNDV